MGSASSASSGTPVTVTAAGRDTLTVPGTSSPRSPGRSPRGTPKSSPRNSPRIKRNSRWTPAGTEGTGSLTVPQHGTPVSSPNVSRKSGIPPIVWVDNKAAVPRASSLGVPQKLIVPGAVASRSPSPSRLAPSPNPTKGTPNSDWLETALEPGETTYSVLQNSGMFNVFIIAINKSLQF